MNIGLFLGLEDINSENMIDPVEEEQIEEVVDGVNEKMVELQSHVIDLRDSMEAYLAMENLGQILKHQQMMGKGIDKSHALMAEMISMESLRKANLTSTITWGLESFDTESERLYANSVSIEGVAEIASAIKDKIKNIFSKATGAISGAFKAIANLFRGYAAKAKALRSKIEKMEGGFEGSANGKYPSLYVNGKLNPISACDNLIKFANSFLFTHAWFDKAVVGLKAMEQYVDEASDDMDFRDFVAGMEKYSKDIANSIGKDSKYDLSDYSHIKLDVYSEGSAKDGMVFAAAVYEAYGPKGGNEGGSINQKQALATLDKIIAFADKMNDFDPGSVVEKFIKKFKLDPAEDGFKGRYSYGKALWMHLAAFIGIVGGASGIVAGVTNLFDGKTIKQIGEDLSKGLGGNSATAALMIIGGAAAIIAGVKVSDKARGKAIAETLKDIDTSKMDKAAIEYNTNMIQILMNIANDTNKATLDAAKDIFGQTLNFIEDCM